jgi:hypothetical protein
MVYRQSKDIPPAAMYTWRVLFTSKSIPACVSILDGAFNLEPKRVSMEPIQKAITMDAKISDVTESQNSRREEKNRKTAATKRTALAPISQGMKAPTYHAGPGLRVHQVSPRIAAHQITNGMNGSHRIKFFMGLFRQSA